VVDAETDLYEDGFVDGEEAFVDASEELTLADNLPAATTESEEEPRSD
jgi:segregation and condensation protein B